MANLKAKVTGDDYVDLVLTELEVGTLMNVSKEAEAKAHTDPVKIYSNIDEFINSIPLGKARELYLALDKIFG